MRSGTENVPGVAALGESAEEIYENFEEKIDHLYQIKQRFVEGVLKIEVCLSMERQDVIPHHRSSV